MVLARAPFAMITNLGLGRRSFNESKLVQMLGRREMPIQQSSCGAFEIYLFISVILSATRQDSAMPAFPL